MIHQTPAGRHRAEAIARRIGAAILVTAVGGSGAIGSIPDAQWGDLKQASEVLPTPGAAMIGIIALLMAWRTNRRIDELIESAKPQAWNPYDDDE